MTRVNVPVPFSPGNVLSAITKQADFAKISALIWALLGVAPAAGACARTTRVDATPTNPPSPDAAPSPVVENDAAVALVPPIDAGAVAAVDATTPWKPIAASEIDGPREIPLEPGRSIYYAFSKSGPRPGRLIGHLHGICGPPVYACGKWLSAGAEAGVLVCPTGNAKCGDSPVSPASWEAPSWNELVTIMDHDLEASVAKVEAKHKGSIDRSGAVLTAYSRGAYAAAVIARMPKNKNKWPYLVLIEASVSLSAASLRAAGVKAVALVAGEQGNEIASERTTTETLTKDGFPARLFVMRKTGHLYSDDMEYVMHDALSWVVSQ